ncbi:MAG TPA: hypothetical protein DCF49_08150 [Lachnospiraceae bacterium]|nr:hypothetical protein [Lachnospiraceae bacterium]
MKRKKSVISLIAVLLCTALSVSSVPAAVVMAEEQAPALTEQETSDALSESADEGIGSEEDITAAEDTGTDQTLTEEEADQPEVSDDGEEGDTAEDSAATGETVPAAEEENGSDEESDEADTGLEEAGESDETDELTSVEVEKDVEADESATNDELTSEVEEAAVNSTTAAAAEELLKEEGKKEAEAATSGNCGANGDNVKWKYAGGTLTITGKGKMDDWDEPDNMWGLTNVVPWDSYRDQITKVVIGEGVTYTGYWAFAGTQITSVTLPSSMKILGQGTFAYCRNLKSVKLNDGLEKIRNLVFLETAVSQLTIPSSVTEISDTLFNEVTDVKFAGTNSNFTTQNGVVFKDGGKTLVHSPRDRSGTYKVPAGVTKIADYAFENAKWDKITLPEGLKEIGQLALAGTGIESIVIPKSVERMGFGAFSGTKLKEIVIPSTVKEIGGYAFSYCDNLVKAQVDCDLAVSFSALFFLDESLETVILSKNVTGIPERTFAGCTSLPSSFTIPGTVKFIGEQAFNSCTQITKVTFGNRLESIGEAAFFNTGLKKVTIPASVKSLGINAFPEGCVIDNKANLITDNEGKFVSTDQITSVDLKVTYGQTEARSMLAMINKFRQSSDAWYYDESGKKVYQKNLSPLKYDYDLEKIAMQRAAELAISFGHERPDGADCITAMENGKSAFGESIAYNCDTAEDAFVTWQETNWGYNGQGHRRIMLSGNLNCIGIGHAVYNGVHFWVQEFGAWDNVNTKKTAAVDSEKTVNMVVGNEYFDSSYISVSPASYLLDVNGTATLPKPSTNKKLAGSLTLKSFPTLAWKSQDTSIVKIQGGKLVGVSKGETYITASVYGGTKKVKVVVGKLATPKLKGTANHSAGIVVKWGKVSGAVNYRIYRKSGTSGWAAVGTSTGESYLDKTAKRGVKYTYTVCAVTADGRFKTSDFSAAGVTAYRLSPVQITALKNTAAGKLLIRWGRNGACSGYQIQYASNKNFTGAKTVTVRNKETLSRTLTGLTKGRRYFVRVRTFKTITGSNYYSVWSTVRSLKLTK